MQLTWTGQPQHVASVASYPPAILAGALADSVLLLRQNTATQDYEVTSRAVGLLQPLVLGWCSLAACGLLPKGLNTARTALQAILQQFDASNITSGLLWALTNSWCWDIAASLSQHGTNVDPTVKLAANAAAGNWSVVVTALQVCAHTVLTQVSHDQFAPLLVMSPSIPQAACNARDRLAVNYTIMFSNDRVTA